MSASKVRKPMQQGKESFAMHSTDTVLLSGVLRALQYATRTREWVVVVSPNDKVTDDIQQQVVATLPEGSSHAGRTSLLPDGGRFSVSTASSPLFIPAGKLFSVVFLGWSSVDPSQYGDMDVWRHSAQHVLDVTRSTGTTST